MIGSSSATSNLVAVPTTAPVAAAISISSRTLAPHRRLRLAIACPPLGPPTCSGRLTLATAKAVSLRKRGRRTVIVLGHATYHVRAGTRVRTSVTLSGAGALLLARLGALPVRLTSASAPTGGVAAAAVRSRTFTLRYRA